MDIVDRLVAYRDYIGLTSSQFADKAGIPRPTLSQFLNGRNKRLSDDMTAKLHAAFPDLNILWLLFGEGDMVTSANIEISEGKNTEKSPQNYTRYVYREAATPYHPARTIVDGVEVNERSKAQSALQAPLSAPNAPGNVPEEPESAQSASVRQEPSSHPQEMTAAKSPAMDFVPQGLSAALAKNRSGESVRKIQSIMVFYTDNSFEIFTPAEGRGE